MIYLTAKMIDLIKEQGTLDFILAVENVLKLEPTKKCPIFRKCF